MRTNLFVLALGVLVSGQLAAQPEGLHVVSGSASKLISNGENSWVIESGKKTILEWNEFSLASYEKLIFQQADVQSAILNRVIGNMSSELLGQLLSNGSVYVH